MKKFLIALLLGVGLLGSTALEAGNLVKMGQDQGTGGSLRDTTNGNTVAEIVSRGLLYSTSTASTITGFATNSSLSITLTGASTNYAGPWWVWVDNTAAGASDAIFAPRNSVTAATSFDAGVTLIEAGKTYLIGPISRRHTHGHFLGRTATTNVKAGVAYAE